MNASMTRLSWPGVGRFVVRHGREIVVHPAPDASEQVLKLFLLGPVLAVVLHQRGCLVLHASAVALNGVAIGFLGGSGWGKSTLAAALNRRGHAFVSDDVLPLRFEQCTPVVLPAVRELRLWPKSLTALGEVGEALPRLRPEIDKRAVPPDGVRVRESLPLARLYVLAEASTRAVEALSPLEAVIELVRHTYTARLLRAHGAVTHLHQCGAVARVVPVRRLRMRRSLDELPALTEFVEQDTCHAS